MKKWNEGGIEASPNDADCKESVQADLGDKVTKHVLSKLEARRDVLGMSKAELARRMEMDSVTVGMMLRGKRGMSIEEALKMCCCLNVHPGELLTPELRELHKRYWG